MTSVTGKWVGAIQGTNTGGVFADLTQSAGSVQGTVHISDPVHGVGVYTVTSGEAGRGSLRLVLTPTKLTRLAGHGIVTVLARTVGDSSFSGEWRSTIGTIGVLSVQKMGTALGDQGQGAPPDDKGSQRRLGTPVSAVPARTTVFISYSHHDSRWLDRLRVHLKPLEREYALDIWDDRRIQPGSQWLEEIGRAIQVASVAVLIVSADFLGSDFIARNELPPLLDSAKTRGALILPVIVSPSLFMESPGLSHFQAINDPQRPLIALSEGEQEEVWVTVSQRILARLQKATDQSGDR